jgi:hypothetical protein
MIKKATPAFGEIDRQSDGDSGIDLVIGSMESVKGDNDQ